MIFNGILNAEVLPATKLNPRLPAARKISSPRRSKKIVDLRYQTAAELRADLMRLQARPRFTRRPAAEKTEPRMPPSTGAAAHSKKSVAVLYFENQSGAKEDEYLRDGITEDIITELSKIRGLNTFSRPTVLAFRDKPVTPAQLASNLAPPCARRHFAPRW